MNRRTHKDAMKRICVIDGQGGGMGSTIIRKLRETLGEGVEVIALGTNAIATAQMLKARANRGASGENAIVQTAARADVILGPLGIVLANAMMGEVTPKMAAAVATSPALKLLLPLSQENVQVVGVATDPLPHLVEALIDDHLKPYLAG
jgi:NAD(P)-dependent dehydrogenase (short-subunit alcohol dehydrogenase family)